MAAVDWTPGIPGRCGIPRMACWGTEASVSRKCTGHVARLVLRVCHRAMGFVGLYTALQGTSTEPASVAPHWAANSRCDGFAALAGRCCCRGYPGGNRRGGAPLLGGLPGGAPAATCAPGARNARCPQGLHPPVRTSRCLDCSRLRGLGQNSRL